MSPQQALEIVSQVCAVALLNANDRNNVNIAIATLVSLNASPIDSKKPEPPVAQDKDQETVPPAQK